MFGWFKPKEVKLQGAPVHINVSSLPVKEKLARAQGRILRLTGKLNKLNARVDRTNPEVAQLIADTEAAIKAWGKVAKLAALEIKLEAE